MIPVLATVLWAGAFLAAQDAPPLREARWRGATVVADELLVTFAPAATAPARRAAHAAAGATRLGAPRPATERVRLPDRADLDALMARYASQPGVVAVQPNVLHRPVTTPNDPKLNLQWNLAKVGAPTAWTGLGRNPDALVAVIDSGVDGDHPDLAAAYAGGHDFHALDADPDDADGHGTHCCGIASAATDNGTGVAGAAWGGRFLAYRAGNATFPTSALVPAIDDAVARGARAISMSWGSSYADPLIGAALADAHAAGVVLVAAAGNDDSSAPFWPAARPDVIAVGSTRQNDARSSFSNHGDWVDVAAPGQGIYSTSLAGGYTFASGTSMSCPLVAGMAAMLSANLGARSPDNAAAVRDALEQTAVDVGTWVAHGRVDFAAAAESLFGGTPALLLAATPDVLPSLAGPTVTLSGGGFAGTTGVTLDASAVPFTVVDDGTLLVGPFDAPALGPVELVVHKPGGPSAPLALVFVENDPPALTIPPTVPDGGEVSWRFGGGAHHVGVLIASLHPATFPYLGFDLLADMIILWVAPLDGAGLGSFGGTLPSGLAGLTFRSQIATLDGGFVGASPIATTTIVP